MIRRIHIWSEHGRWWWRCDLCHPPTTGSRRVWADIVRVSLPHHFRVRHCHHAYVAKHR